MEVLYEYSGDGDPNRLVLYAGGTINVIQDYEGWAYGELDGAVVSALCPFASYSVLTLTLFKGTLPSQLCTQYLDRDFMKR